MDRNPKKILSDLSTIDPRFKQKSAELEAALSTFITHQPKAEIRSDFFNTLRSQLTTSVMVSVDPVKPKKLIKSPFGLIRSSFESRSSILVALLAFLIITPLTYVVTEKSIETIDLKDVTSSLSQKQQITIKPSNAFGTLPLAKTVAANSGARLMQNDGVVAPQAKMMAAEPVMMSTMIATSSSTSTSPANATSTQEVSAPQIALAKTARVQPSYYYAGKPLSLKAEDSVLKRTTGTDASSAMLAILKGLHFDLTNLSSFNSLSLKTVTLQENKPYGYNLIVDMARGSIDIVQDVKQWPDQAQASTTVLSQKAAQAIGTEFLTAHGVTITNYGAPKLVGSSSMGTTILYPLLIDSREVYDEDGVQYGITVTVDAQTKKVSEVRNIISQLFESSKYPLENDPLKVLSSIGAAASATSVPNAIPLQEPKQIYIRTTQEGATPAVNELYIPSLYFKTDGKAASTTLKNVPKALFAPLVKDLLQSSLFKSTTTQA